MLCGVMRDFCKYELIWLHNQSLTNEMAIFTGYNIYW